MERKRFEALVKEGIDAIPERFLARLKNVAFVIADRPTKAQKGELGTRRGERLLGLYEGVPATERGDDYGFAMPDKITIFQKEIEDVAATDEDVKKEVFDTVWHEVAHYFGMGEEEVFSREMEREEERKKKR